MEDILEINKSINILKNIGLDQKYLENERMYWMKNNPNFLVAINNIGNIFLFNTLNKRHVSILEFWEEFNNKQKKIIIFNIDKFL